MQEIKVSELVSHPKNEFFFDDMEGQKWVEFLESIKTSGVIEPIVITQDKMIVSGHQRTRACKELGIDTVVCEVKIYDDEDKIIKDLLETNVRQRGDIGGSSVKIKNRILELERIYGISHGGDRKSTSPMDNLKTQEDIAAELGFSLSEYHRYKKLSSLIPEIESLVDDKISTSVASRIIARLSEDEQKELLQSLDMTKKLTQKEVQEYVDRIKVLENKPDKIIDNTDYKSIERLNTDVSNKQQDIDRLQRDKDLLDRKVKLNESEAKQFGELKKQIDFLSKEKDDISRQITSATELSGLVVRIDNVLKTELSPIRYSRTLERLDSEVAIKNLVDIINSVQSWVDDMRIIIKNKDIVEVYINE